MANALILLNLINSWGASVLAASDLLKKAAADGNRDVTPEELAELSAQAQSAIDAAAQA